MPKFGEVKSLKKAFVIDFDGTITRRDVGFSIVQELTDNKWKQFEEQWANQKLRTDEFSQIKWSSIKYDLEQMKRYVKEFLINPGFKEFISKMKEESNKVLIASDGYDVYINEIFSDEYKDLNVVCNNASYDKEWKLTFPNRDEQCGLCGNCKKKLVQDLKEKGYEVYYIGDGDSDKCASLYADKIFAKSILKEHCDENNIEYYKFDDFFDVINQL